MSDREMSKNDAIKNRVSESIKTMRWILFFSIPTFGS